MCSKSPRNSCANTPINSHVIPAWDEHYRRDQTHIPTRYQSACELESCFNPTEFTGGCGATIEHMHGGGGHGSGSGHGGGGHGSGNWRPRNVYIGSGGGWGNGGWGWPWYYNPVIVRPTMYDSGMGMWFLIAALILAVFYFARKR